MDLKLEKRVRGKLHRSCEVCGKVAIGIRYGIYSCGSCKRNHIYSPDDFKCETGRRFAKSCDTTQTTACRKCRLEKCLQVGMRTSMKGRFEHDDAMNMSLKAPPKLAVHEATRAFLRHVITERARWKQKVSTGSLEDGADDDYSDLDSIEPSIGPYSCSPFLEEEFVTKSNSPAVSTLQSNSILEPDMTQYDF